VFGVKVRLSSAELRAGMSADVVFPNMALGGEVVK
jgi:hypothetical protein